MAKTTFIGIFAVVILMILLFVFGCNQVVSSQQKLELVLNSSENCRSPCWQDMIPGVSTESELESTIPSRNCQIFTPGKKQCTWSDRQMSWNVRAEFQEDILLYIQFMPGPKAVTLQQVFETLGPPDTYVAHLNHDNNTWFQMSWFYEQEGVMVTVFDQFQKFPLTALPPTCTLEVDPESFIRSIAFIGPNLDIELASQTSGLGVSLHNNEKFTRWTKWESLSLTDCSS